MPDLLLIRSTDGAMRPADEVSWSKARKLPVGEPCHATVRDPSRRSGRQHAFAFALMGELFKNQSHYTDFDHFRQALLIRLGRCDWHEFKDGARFPIAHSLSYGAMSADEFGELVDAILDFAVEMGWEREALLANTREFAA